MRQIINLKSALLALFTGIAMFVLMSLSNVVYAVPANPAPRSFTQPNGAVIQVFLKGDEFLNWSEDVAGNLIVFDSSRKAYYYADWTEEGPVSTGELVYIPKTSVSEMWGILRTKGRDIPASVLDKAVRQREELMPLPLSNNIWRPGESFATATVPQTAPASSLKRNLLMVHVTWSDRTGINTPKLDGNQIYDLVFNPATNSVNRYYKELFGFTADDIIVPATVNRPLDSKAGIIEVTVSGQHTNPGQDNLSLLQIVLEQVSAQGLVNFSIFDTNGNGIIETTELSIGMIVDGYETSAGMTGPSVWGTAWRTYGNLVSPSLTNGVQLQYAFLQGAFHNNSGNTANDMLTVGIICHELGHSGYGFADTYDYTYTSAGHGDWSLMAGGSWGYKAGEKMGQTPSYVDAFNLVYRDVVNPGIISASENNVTINNHLDIFRVNNSVNAGQYFLLQQRKYGTTDNYDRGAFYSINTASNANTGGLLIYHYDQTVVESPDRSNKRTHYAAGIAEAHGGTQHMPSNANYGDLNDLWGSAYKTFNDTTDPNTKLYSPFTNNSVPPSKNIPSGVEINSINWNSATRSTSFNVVYAVGLIRASPSLIRFGSLASPYTQPAAQTVIIKNVGTSAVALTPPTATNYIIGTLSATILAPEATATFTVCPKPGLATGTYDETITIIGSSGAATTVEARFNVVPAATMVMSVSNFTELQSAINSYNTATDNLVINVTASFSMTAGLTIPANNNGASLTIRSGNAVLPPVTLTRGTNSVLFLIESRARLILEDIIIDGNKSVYTGDQAGLMLVYVRGDLTMKDGAVLKNNVERNLAGGGGVHVANSGVFDMTGGEISGNESLSEGGGVYVAINGLFSMSGGKISGNTIDVQSIFGPNAGGGVSTRSNNKFTMTGGEISGNTAGHWGGGVYSTAEFIMAGGEISGNTVTQGHGGGVIGHGKFTMTGGKISDNKIASVMSGGGVSVSRTSIFTMTGGEISGNTSGVGTYDFGTPPDVVFYFGGTALISGNTSGNVRLKDSLTPQYIALSTMIPPASGMNVGIRTEHASGVIIGTGATAADATHFFADEVSKAVVYENGQLIIKVPAVPVYRISASTLTSFGALQTPYTQPAAQTVIITNTGTGTVTLTPPTATNYDIETHSGTTITQGQTATFAVRPKAGLAAGNHNETITINGSNGASTTISASFTVTSAVTYANVFPDINFRNEVLRLLNASDGGSRTAASVISQYDYNWMATRTLLSAYRMNIADMTGLQYFTALQYLDCCSNQLTTLDVSKNTALGTLRCYDNQLTSLDVSKNTALAFLDCCSNQLTSLDVSNNTWLINLDCGLNQLTLLDVSKNTALTQLLCYSNQLTSLDVSKNTALTQLFCNSNQLTSLDVSKNTALTALLCYSNQLTTLDVSKNTALGTLRCYDNQLTSLDVSKNTALRWLECNYNYMKSTDDVIGWQTIPGLVLGNTFRFAPQKTVTISPKTATLFTGGTQTFTASVTGINPATVIWSASAGTFTANVFTAPSTPQTVTVTATSSVDSKAYDTATVTVDYAPISVVVSPKTYTMATNNSHAFTAHVTGGLGNTNVTWQATGGTITPAGVYTAPNTPGEYVITATSVEDNTKSDTATVTVVAGIVVEVSPKTYTMTVNGSHAFIAHVTGGMGNTNVTWTVSPTGGSITPAGVYTAPNTPGEYVITATSVEDSTKSDTATVTVVAGIVVEVSPKTYTMTVNGSHAFTAHVTGGLGNTNVTWQATGGSITPAGVYTAPSTPGEYVITATSVEDNTKSDTATVTVVAGIVVEVSPKTYTMTVNGSHAFIAHVTGGLGNTNVTWTVSPGGGTITPAGVYTAPSTPGEYVITATSVEDSTKSDTATITVVAGIVVEVSPKTYTMTVNGSHAFIAHVTGGLGNTNVTWQTTGGTITPAGVYTAPNTPGEYVITATSVEDNTKSDMATVTVVAGIVVEVSPKTYTMTVNGSHAFTAHVTGGLGNTNVTWQATGGSISPAGVYTAPNTPGEYVITATSVEDNTKSDTATVTVVAGIVVEVSPKTYTMTVNGSHAFIAHVTGGMGNTNVTWTVSPGGGTITPAGVYTAPNTPGEYVITATSVEDNTKSDTATITVVAGIVVHVSPKTHTMTVNGTYTFTAQVEGGLGNTNVTWTVSPTGGSITPAGVYTAPNTPGEYVITATSVEDSTKSDTATVYVLAPTYTISASTISSFGSLQIPYTQPAAQTVTITNTGTGSVTLTQPTATNYDIGTLSRTTIAQSETATFTVRPKAGLAAGNYPETITINGNNGASTTVSASFTVTPALTYTISASPNPSFGSLQTPYTQPAAQTVTITNTGTGSVTLTQPTASNYDIGVLSRATIAQSETATFTVRPKAGLAAGNYPETITINGNNGASTTINATFTVTPAVPAGTITINTPPAALLTTETHTFQATITGLGNTAVTWTATGGTINSTTGHYTAPATAQNVTITATSQQEPALKATITIKISSANFDGNTKTTPSLLGLANAYGSTNPSDLALYDLNGDGRIDDEDIRVLFKGMGW